MATVPATAELVVKPSPTLKSRKLEELVLMLGNLDGIVLGNSKIAFVDHYKNK